MAVFGFILGLVLGSFVKAASERIAGNKSVLGRSYCPHCKKTLRWYDLFPVFSYLFLKGRCRYCRKAIPKDYLITEVIMGVLLALIFTVTLPGNPERLLSLNLESVISLVTLFFNSFLLVVFALIFLIDWQTGYIPDKIVFPAAAVSALFLALVPAAKTPPEISLLAAVSASSFFALLIFLTRGRGMGWGDVKYVLFLGLALGFPNIAVAIFLAFVLGAIFSLLLISFGKKHFGQTIPFGPFLSAGALIAMLWGTQIISWYLNSINPGGFS